MAKETVRAKTSIKELHEIIADLAQAQDELLHRVEALEKHHPPEGDFGIGVDPE